MPGERRIVFIVGVAAGSFGCLFALRAYIVSLRRTVANLSENVARLEEHVRHLEDVIGRSYPGNPSALNKSISSSDEDVYLDSVAEPSCASDEADTVLRLLSSESGLLPFIPVEYADALPAAYSITKRRVEALPSAANYQTLLQHASLSYHLAWKKHCCGNELQECKALFREAKAYALAASELNQSDADVHKWCAVTLGVGHLFLPFTELMAIVPAFHRHLSLARELKPDDWFIRFIVGRAYYEIASLSFFKRQLLRTIVGSTAAVTYEDSLDELNEAKKLCSEPVLAVDVALCHTLVKLGRATEARALLREVSEIPAKYLGDDLLIADLYRMIGELE